MTTQTASSSYTPPARKIERYLSVRDILPRLGVSRATWDRWRRSGYAPQPVHLGPRLVKWRESEIETFLARAAADRGARP